MFLNCNKTIKLINKFLQESESIIEGPSNLRLSRIAKKMGLEHYGNVYYGPEGQKGKVSPTHKSQDGKIVPLSDKEKQAIEKGGIPDVKPAAGSRLAAKHVGGVKKPPARKPVQTKNMPINVNLSPVDHLMDKPTDQLTNSDLEMLRGNDIQKIQNSLNMTREQALADKKMNRRLEGVGAGTFVSRAGESAIVDGMQSVFRKLSNKKLNDRSYEETFLHELDRYYDNLLESLTPNMFLTKEWIKAARASSKQIIAQIGAANIKEIVWDTPEGRKIVNTENHNTSADMFILDKSGQRWGISLKKSGSVFLMNRGNNQAMMDIAQHLRQSGMTDKDIAQFMDEVSDANYKEDLDRAVEETRLAINKNKKLKAELLNLAYRLQKGKISDYRKIKKYLNRIDEDFFNRPWTSADLKIITRLMEYGQSDDSTVEFEKMEELRNKFRQAELKAAKRWTDQIKLNPDVNMAIKSLIVDGTHMFDALGINLAKGSSLDKFIQVYGEGDAGLVMNDVNVSKFFTDNKHEMKIWNELLSKAKKGDKRSENLLKNVIYNRIRIDFSGSTQGKVVYKRSNPNPPPPHLEYTIFDLRVRVKDLGTAPSIQLEQNLGFTQALKYGTDINEWPPKEKAQYYSEELKKIILDTARSSTINARSSSLEILGLISSKEASVIRQKLGAFVGDDKVKNFERKIIRKYLRGDYDE